MGQGVPPVRLAITLAFANMDDLAFGYIRVPSAAEPAKIEQLHAAVAAGARAAGLTISRVFSENVRDRESAFNELVAELQQRDVHDVIVPSLRHFASSPDLQQAMKSYLEQEAGARVWVTQG
jgi:hypothetical protein